MNKNSISPNYECSLCPIYLKKKEMNEIAILKCNHTFCWTCLDVYMQENMKNIIKCPESTCNKNISDSVIRKTLSKDNIEKYESHCLQCLQQKHNCLLPQCSGIITYTDPNLQYQCQLCGLYNCVLCKAAHGFQNCETFKSRSTKQQKKICDEELARAAEVIKREESQKNRNIFQFESDSDILQNDHTFSCPICTKSVLKGEGVKLRNCLDHICRTCLKEHLQFCSDVPVKCPLGCNKLISDREIYSLLTEEEIKCYQNKYNLLLKRRQQKYLQCKFPNCDSFFFYTEVPTDFKCTKCNSLNCVRCAVVHDKENCEQYLKQKEFNRNKFIENNIKQKKIMECPKCHNLLCKISGCNWIKCNKCLVELCWIRQMYRWGPKGRGDISGGCGCDIKGKKCHPECLGCVPDRI